MTTLAQQENLKKYEEAVLNYLIDQEATNFKELYCNENYYKNVLLYHSLHNNISMQCIVREYAEGIKSASTSSGHKATDILHVNALLSYLNIYCDIEKTEELNTICFNFRNHMTSCTPYLIGKPDGRIKSLMSFESKIRSKISVIEAIRKIVDNRNQIKTSLQTLLGNNSDNSSEIAKFKKIKESINKFLTTYPSDTAINNYLINLIEKKSSLSNIIKDVIGYRFIIYSLDKEIKEDNMKKFLITNFTTEIKSFFFENGIAFVPDGFKDYISKPKANNYMSLHYIFELQDFSFEFQARTWFMHDVAEFGIASHKSYKDNNGVYSFLDMFFIKDMDKQKIAMMALLGITEPLDISNRPWISIPVKEVPRTLSQVMEYSYKELLEEAIANSP